MSEKYRTMIVIESRKEAILGYIQVTRPENGNRFDAQHHNREYEPGGELTLDEHSEMERTSHTYQNTKCVQEFNRTVCC
jgi:hypothetical protein